MQILVVCTGNICRSPMGEVVLRRALMDAGLAPRATVASAGTWEGMFGEPADPRAVAVAARRGYDLSRFVARGVSRSDYARCHLMLAMTQGHVEELESMRPRGSRVNIKRYLDLTPELVQRDVADPYLGTESDFEEALDRIEEGVAGVVAFVRARWGG